MIIYYHCTRDSTLLLSFLLTCHPLPFHKKNCTWYTSFFNIISTNMPMGSENCYCYACAEIYVPCHMAGRLAMASSWVGLGGKSDI